MAPDDDSELEDHTHRHQPNTGQKQWNVSGAVADGRDEPSDEQAHMICKQRETDLGTQIHVGRKSRFRISVAVAERAVVLAGESARSAQVTAGDGRRRRGRRGPRP